MGKSTLLNHLLGQKISITSRKPQTTRHQVLGIKTTRQTQIVYVDTPGMHREEPRAINRYMNRAAAAALRDVDVVLLLLDRTAFTEEDAWVLQQVAQARRPTLAVINKIDLLRDKAELLPQLQKIADMKIVEEVIPVSALKQQNIDTLEAEIVRRIPRGEFHFPEEQITDRSTRFLAAEIIREKIMRQLGEELPYAITVEIEAFSQEGEIAHISAVIFVERKGQKKILIGERGSRLRRIGSEARLDMERLFDTKVMLHLWVKVKAGWSDDERALRSLGYDDKEV